MVKTKRGSCEDPQLSLRIKNSRGQLTLFVIIALIVVAGVIIYFAFFKDIFGASVSKDLKPVYNSYLSCIEARTKEGIYLMSQQGGYIYTEELKFSPGSYYMPFSSQLNFLGSSLPYWFYISGNNIIENQKPSLSKMEQELSRFVEEGIANCNFDNFNKQGVFLNVYNGSVSVKINKNSVDVSWNNPVSMSFENQSTIISQHEISVTSKLGKFYNYAVSIYENEMNKTFLEDYTLDVMRMYAPVTGVDLSCAPKYFNDAEIRQNITQALETNLPYIKAKGSYYASSVNNYFVQDMGQSFDEQVNFIYSSSWPSRIELYGDRIAKPLGTQAGLGILGFCYVPYHFVYDIDYPVLVQIMDDNEIFQFPMVVIIDKSQARVSSMSGEISLSESEVCKYANQDVAVSTYDLQLNPVAARVNFQCLGESCYIGETKVSGGNANLDAKVPQCVNGLLQVSAEGYAPSETIISTNSESRADILIKKLYNVSLDLGAIRGEALVLFSSPEYSTSVIYPSEKSVKLIESDYNISVYVYSNSSIVFPATSSRQCFSVPSSGLGGILGGQENKCFDVNLPEQQIENVLIGGGKTYDYFAENMLKNSKKLNVNVALFPTPTKIEDLQKVYSEVEGASLDLNFI